jgi:hypothetical protein
MAGIIDDIVQKDPNLSFGIKGEKPTDTPTDKPIDKPMDKPVDKPVDTPTDKIVDKPVDKPTGEPKDIIKDKIPSEPSPEEFSRKILSNINERLGTQYNDLDALKKDYSQLGTLRESERQLQERLQKASNPFGDDTEMAEMFGFRKETNRDYDDYFLLKNIDLETADSLDIMVADAILNNPSLKNKEVLVKKAFEKKYNLVGDDLEESDIESNKINLDIDSSKARASISDLKSKIKAHEFTSDLPPATDPKVLEQNQAKWKENIPRIANALSDFKIFENPDDEKDGKEPFSTIEIPKELQETYVSKLEGYISQSNAEPTEDNMNELYGLMVQDYVVNNYMDIAQNYAAKKLEANNTMWKERTGVDISKLGKDVVPKTSDSDVDKFNKEQLDDVLGRIGVKKK